MKRWTRVLWGAVPLAVAILAGGVADAKVKVDPACATDVAKLCKAAHEEATWDLTVFDCLADNQDRLTKACRTYVLSRASCEYDVGRYCDGRIFADTRDCLARKADNLTHDCRAQQGLEPAAERAQAKAPVSETNYGDCYCMIQPPPEAIQARCQDSW